jgi:hypothetical protein
LVGEKVGRGEKDFSFTFHWPPNLGSTHQALDLLSPSFSFSLKGGLIGTIFSSDIIFNSIWKILIFASLLRRKRMISFGSGRKESIMGIL